MRFQKLQEHNDYEQILRILNHYVNETIPAPAETAGKLWVITAMPDTSGGARIACISCSMTETLVIFKAGTFDHDKTWAFININPDKDGFVPNLDPAYRVDYKQIPNAVRLEFNSLNDLESALYDDFLLDRAYDANASLMRNGSTPLKKYNNPYLIDALLSVDPKELESREIMYLDYLHAVLPKDDFEAIMDELSKDDQNS